MTEARELGRRGRVPCPVCGAMIIDGAIKCWSCRSWLVAPEKRRRSGARYARSLTLIVVAVVSTAAVLISKRGSPVGEAPPLTPLPTGSAEVSAALTGQPDTGPMSEPEVLPINDGEDETNDPAADVWRSRQINIDVRPLDLAFHPDGRSIYVSTNDATLREYDLETNKLLHMVSAPALGDRIKLLHRRFVAIICRTDAVRIPVVDTDDWEADPMLLHVGRNPADIIELADGKTAVAASSAGKLLSWFDLTSGRRLADIKLPHATRNLFLLKALDHYYVGAMGQLYRSEQLAGSWMDLFDPSEKPFGATRRSISVGRDSRPGAVTSDLSQILYADHASNTASLMRLDSTMSKTVSVTVGQGPEEAYILGGDRYGVTINTASKTVTIIDLATMKRLSTLMLNGEPRTAAVSPDGSLMFVSLGGKMWPPDGRGAVVIGGDPPQIVANLKTGRGASQIAVSADGRKAAVANYWSQSISLIDRP